MYQKIFLPLVIAATIIVPSIPKLVQAQTQTQTTRIGDLGSPQGITISGKVQSIVGNDFILDDGSGQVIVDAGPRWWREINLKQGEQVTVIGELGRSGEFDAFRITRADRSVIEIRSPEGPPPWAGGPNRAKPKK
ncbi:DNA-binding protein [Chlorogloeopsis sp. ULAP02]|uniref:DNA-binding protein n=1 Tax=Chlorogloeopsis sp. ULAP02 TaxID=3107926 RepID=UPI0031353C69